MSIGTDKVYVIKYKAFDYNELKDILITATIKQSCTTLTASSTKPSLNKD